MPCGSSAAPSLGVGGANDACPRPSFSVAPIEIFTGVNPSLVEEVPDGDWKGLDVRVGVVEEGTASSESLRKTPHVKHLIVRSVVPGAD